MDRPFFNHSIDDLEAYVGVNSSSELELKNVRDELTFRKDKKRNRSLLEKVHNHLFQLSNNKIHISLPDCWIATKEFEELLSKCLIKPLEEIDFLKVTVGPECKIMIGPALRLLSIINHAVELGVETSIQFFGSNSDVMGYLHRMRFFDHIPEQVSLSPSYKSLKERSKYDGQNKQLVEILEIPLDKEDQSISQRLVDSLLECTDSSNISLENKGKFKTSVTKIFEELIDNVRLHSESKYPAYAVCQYYPYKGKIHVSVCDSGTGLLNTLRPALPIHYPENPEYQNYTDDALVQVMFEKGLSQRGPEKGDGLVSCAKHAIKYNAVVDVRINSSFVTLRKNDNHLNVDKLCSENEIINVDGTHITFEFDLESLTS